MAYQRKQRAYEQEPQQHVPQPQPSLFASPELETEEVDNPYAVAGPTAAPNWEAVQRQIDNPLFDFGKISILPPDSAVQRQPVDPSTLSKRERFIQRVFNVQREPVVSSMSRPPGPLDHHFAAPREDGLEDCQRMASQPPASGNIPLFPKEEPVRQEPTIPMVQAKLTVGPAGDRYEQEADRVASQVVDKINSPEASQPIQRERAQPGGKEAVQRMGEGEERQMKSPLQRVGLEGMPVSNELEADIQNEKGKGHALEPNLQQKMGQAMGTDLSGVKIHTDTKADQLSQAIQAKAFTTGSDVFFRQGEYNTSSKGGQEVIAHELTHIVQQRQLQPKLVQCTPDDALKVANELGKKKFEKQQPAKKKKKKKKKKDVTNKTKLTDINKTDVKNASESNDNDNTNTKPLKKAKPKKKGFVAYESYQKFLSDESTQKKLYSKEDLQVIARTAKMPEGFIRETTKYSQDEYGSPPIEPLFELPPAPDVELPNGEVIKPKELLLALPGVGKFQIMLYHNASVTSKDKVLAWASHGVWLSDKGQADIPKDTSVETIAHSVKLGQNLGWVDSLGDEIDYLHFGFADYEQAVNQDPDQAWPPLDIGQNAKKQNKDNKVKDDTKEDYSIKGMEQMVLGGHTEWAELQWNMRAAALAKGVLETGGLAVLSNVQLDEEYGKNITEETELENYVRIEDWLQLLASHDTLKAYKNIFMLTCRTDYRQNLQKKEKGGIKKESTYGDEAPIKPNEPAYPDDYWK
ncbi:MAG: DUF4157 domain-containing protein [Cyanobacteria bacterium J06639_16]